VKLPCPTVVETGFGMVCGTDVAGARSAEAGVAVATCVARESGRLTARQTAQARAVSHERRQPRTLPVHRVDLVVLMNPTSRAGE